MARILAEFGFHVAAMLVQFFADFCRFLDLFRGFGTFWERLVGLYRFVDDLPGFGSILGQFWGPMLEPVWKPRRLEIGKMMIFYHFLELVRGMLFLRRFWDDFCSARKAKNEPKCGSVCSDSLFRVRNIRSISDASWARFWEGLGSILGGFSVPRAKKRRSRAS